MITPLGVLGYIRELYPDKTIEADSENLMTLATVVAYMVVKGESWFIKQALEDTARIMDIKHNTVITRIRRAKEYLDQEEKTEKELVLMLTGYVRRKSIEHR